jgi:hypothetical protein
MLVMLIRLQAGGNKLQPIAHIAACIILWSNVLGQHLGNPIVEIKNFIVGKLAIRSGVGYCGGNN